VSLDPALLVVDAFNRDAVQLGDPHPV
jgi:hypothetical protein